MPIKYPLTTVTNAGKYAFCYRLQEALRLKHNEIGQKFKDGKMTGEERDVWLKTWYDPREEQLISILLSLRYIIKTNNPQGIKLEEVIKL